MTAQGILGGRSLAGAVVSAVAMGLLAAAPVSASTSEFYVDRTVSGCSDSGVGSASVPFCTVAKGASSLTAGATLFIGNGTYAETLTPPTSGTASQPITITAWPGRAPTLGVGKDNGVYLSGRSYVTVSGLRIRSTVRHGISVSGSSHITISGNEVTFAGKPESGKAATGIYVGSTTDSVVTRNVASRNTQSGLYASSGTTRTTFSYNAAAFNAAGYTRMATGIWITSTGNSFIGNVAHDNEDTGLNFYGGSGNNLATLNVAYNNGDHGIDNLNVNGGQIIGNTIYRNCTSGINIEGTSHDFVVKNNIAVDNAVYPAYNGISCSRRAGNIGVYDSAPPSTVADHNLVWLTKSGKLYVFGSSYTSLAALQSAKGQESHGIQADPKFASASGFDLRLTSGSPAIDRGDSGAPGEQPADILGTQRVRDPSADNSMAEGPRRYDDLGAYEYPAVPVPPQAPVAALSVSPSSGAAPLVVSASAAGSSDPQGRPLTYAFDFGDGSAVVGPQAGSGAGHTFAAAGGYTVRVTVANDAGLSSTATRAVTVTAPAPPEAPVAALSVSPSSGAAPLVVSASAAGSSDPQGRPLTYAFDFGDGSAVVGPQSGSGAGHTFAAAGGYTVRVTVANDAGLSSTATRAVTVTAPAPPEEPPEAPVAALSVSPSSGAAPLVVSASAAGSSDPQGRPLTYAFNFGDGSAVVGPQSGSGAGHTFAAAGGYTVRVTVANDAGLSSTAMRAVTVTAPEPPPPPPATPPAYVSQVATNFSTSSKTSGTLTVWRSAGVQAGSLAVVTLQLFGNTTPGAVTATDPKGNSYSVASDVSDGSGSRLVILYSRIATALAVNDRITASFPTSATGYRITADEFSGVTALDRTASSSGDTAQFSSGATAATTAGSEVVFGAVASTAGSGNPSWASGWSAGSAYAVGTSYLGRAHRLPTASGTFTASGTTSGTWLASVVTFKP